MKHILIIIPFLTIFCCGMAAEKGSFKIEGRIKSLNDPAEKVFLFYNDRATGYPIIDSTTLDNGTFSFKGNLEYPVYARIVYTFNGNINYATAGDERKFYLEEGNITIRGVQLFNAEIKGSETQDLLMEYFNEVRPVQEEMIRVNQEKDDIYMPYSTEYRSSLDSTFRSLQAKYNELSMNFVATHLNSILAVDMLSSEYATHPDNEKVEELYEQLSDNLKKTPSARSLKYAILNKNRIKHGNIAPDFMAMTPTGNSISLSSYKGKWVLLVFWSPTCDICLRESKELKEMYSKYKDKGFEIIAFAIQDETGEKEWKQAVSDLDISYTTVSDSKDWSSPIVQEYQINGVPENYLINPNGLITSLDLFGSSLQKELAKVFGF